MTQHGLPGQHRTPPGEVEDWSAALGYLHSLKESRRPILATIEAPDATAITRQIGYLRERGPVREGDASSSRFAGQPLLTSSDYGWSFWALTSYSPIRCSVDDLSTADEIANRWAETADCFPRPS